MSDTSTEQDPPNQPPQAEIKPARRLSIVWLIPVIVAAVGGWFAYKAISEKDISITIAFDTAEGLEGGKTKIIYKGVQAGIVDEIHVSEDLSHAIVYATVVKRGAHILKENTQFWVVRPQISAAGVSGLSTLISGDYIALKPGDGAPATAFKGLNEAPISSDDGRTFTVHADDLGSIHISAPIYHQGIKVGKVRKYEFAKDHDGVVIQILIDNKHADLVRRNSVFWNVSAIDLELGNLVNASLRVGSLENLLAGGIAFAHPPNATKPAPAEAVFRLHDKRPTSFVDPVAAKGLRLVLTAKKLGGVNAGDKVTYRQLVVGKVYETRLTKNATEVEIDVIIDPKHAALVHANTQFWNASGLRLKVNNLMDASLEVTSLESLIAGGIAFLTPAKRGPRAKSGHRFALLHERPGDLGEEADAAARNFKVNLTTKNLRGVREGDPVFYRAIEIGKVHRTRFNKAANGIEIELGIYPKNAALVRTNSVFWNASGVKFKMGNLIDASVEVESVKSLLIGGIALTNPAKKAPRAKPGAVYRLHTDRPNSLIRHEKVADGLHLVLKSEILGSVDIDDPVLYREVEVGIVTDVELGDDASYVAIHISIDPGYAPLVRSKTVFWNASGIHASLGLSGAKVDFESLSALLRGGIAFATPKDGGKEISTGAVFKLHPELDEDWREWAPHIRVHK